MPAYRIHSTVGKKISFTLKYKQNKMFAAKMLVRL